MLQKEGWVVGAACRGFAPHPQDLPGHDTSVTIQHESLPWVKCSEVSTFQSFLSLR
jgi:hypothetical protein